MAANRAASASTNATVYQLDGKTISLNITESTKVRHALLMIKELIGLKNDADFSLYELRGGFAVGSFLSLIHI